MKWFRLHTEARTDRKLDTLSDAEFRVWFNLLCLAAEQPERGTIEFEDVEILALEVAKGDVELLRHALSRLSRLRSVTCEERRVTFVNFAKRQYDKPSDWPSETRQRKAKQRQSVPETRDSAGHGVTPRDVTPQIQNRTDTDTEKEETHVQNAFGEWYAMYPKKEHRLDAEKAWARMDPDERVAACARLPLFQPYYASCERRFIPLPASWLNGKRWTDDPPSPRSQNGKPKGPDFMRLVKEFEDAESGHSEGDDDFAGDVAEPPVERREPRRLPHRT